ncbi:hypothetical protein MASR2M78_28910 [Treponema sp.]
MTKIAICEDEHIVALDIKRHLERFGYQILGTYASGEAIIELCTREKPDLILMDIQLQGEIDGVEAARSIYDTYAIPVILLTAFADDATIARAKDSRPFGYIIKPFEERELKTAIEIALYRHAMDLKLRSSEERYRGLFEEAPSANFTASEDGRITDCNSAFVSLLAFTDEVAACSSSLIDRFIDQIEGRTVFERILSDSPLSVEEWSLTRVDGRSIQVLATLGKALSEDGSLRELRGYLVDVTDRHELETQLRQAQKMEAIGRLAGGVAHDFNNIITAIMGYCNLLAEDIGDDTTMMEELEGIQSAARRAVNLTRQLLSFSRKQTVETQIIDANRALVDLEKMARRLVPETINLKFFQDAKKALISMDAGQFEQVLINLIVNAKDAIRETPSGGSIVVETWNVHSDGSGKNHGLGVGDWLGISVRDNGEGIAKQNLQRIFEPFFTTKGTNEGTGLGLSTVYAIINRSGGHVAVESDLGKGTNFFIYFPLAAGQTVPSLAPLLEPLGQVRTGTLLLAEDDDYLRGLLSRILTKAGYRVLEASNPGEAILIAEREQDFMLITDVVMPRMNGYELAERLSASVAKLRVLFMSGYHDKREVSTSPLYEKSTFLSKPFTHSQLMEALSLLES